MFDLFRSRDKAVRILLGVILGIVALSMVTYLIPGTGTGTSTNDDSVIAKVGDQRVTTQAALQAVARTMRQRQFPQTMAGFLAPQVIQGMINEDAVAYEAKRLGIKVSDDDLNTAIRQQLPPSFVQKDGSINQDMLTQALSQQDMTVNDFIDQVRRDLIVSRLVQLVSAGVVVTKNDIQQEYKRHNEKIKIEYVLVRPASVEQSVQVSPSEVESYFAKNRQAYQIPAQKSLAIVLLDPAKVEQSVTPSDADLQSAYNSSLDRFRTPERVKLRHILIATDATTNDSQAKAKAEDVEKQLKAGGDFADLAKKYSKDPGSAAKGGELDYISRGQTVPPFEQAAFSLKPGETSGLVKTTYGYHIIQVEQKEDARVKPFTEVHDLLAGEYRKRKANEMMQQLADRAASDLKKDPAHPEKAAEDAKGELIRAANLKPGDPIPQIGASQELQNAVLTLKVNGVSSPVTVPGNRIAVAEVTSDAPAHPANLDDVRAKVEDAVRRQKTDALVDQKVNELAAKAKADGGDLAKAAKDMGLEVKQSNDFDRQGAVEGFGSASILASAFTAKDGSIVGPLNSADGKAVVKVDSHTPADMAGFAAQETTIRNDLKDKVARERVELFQAGVRSRLEKDGKVKVQQDALNRLLQSFRS